MQRSTLERTRRHRATVCAFTVLVLVSIPSVARAGDDGFAGAEPAAEETPAPDEVPARPGTDTAPPAPEESPVTFTPVWEREPLEVPNSLRGVYDKPFLAEIWRTVSLGGYTEFEYHSFEDGVLGIPEGFRMHRTNLFLFADIGDRIRFGSELEFETEFEGPEPSSETETVLEMAFVDWVLFEELKLRAGALLPPLGRTNVNHDGPVRELTERSLVATFIIPTTLTEAGAGAWGDFDLSDAFALRYEAYAVNGFDLLDDDGTLVVDPIEREQILRAGGDSIGGDGNGEVAWTGRIGVDAFGKLELGASWHIGTYDEREDNWLYIFAGDLAWVQPLAISERPFGELAFEGEIASARFERDAFARTAGVPDDFWGYSAQVAWSGMPPALRESVPHIFDDKGARLGAVFRYEWVDLDGDHGEVLEPGVTFRPLADTVFKLSYRFTQRSIGVRDVPGRDEFEDDGVAFSVTTYF